MAELVRLVYLRSKERRENRRSQEWRQKTFQTFLLRLLGFLFLIFVCPVVLILVSLYFFPPFRFVLFFSLFFFLFLGEASAKRLISPGLLLVGENLGQIRRRNGRENGAGIDRVSAELVPQRSL